MGKMFSSPKPKKDPNQEALLRRQREELAEQDSEVAERKAVRRRFAQGRASLISGSETGVPQRASLG